MLYDIILPMLKEPLLTYEELTSPDNPQIVRVHLFNEEEIDQYLQENFQEFDFNHLNRILGAFGFNKSELVVFFSNHKGGLLAIQPALVGGTSIDNATATFSWHVDKSSGKKVFSISGMRGDKHKSIIAAKYEEYHAEPKEVPWSLRTTIYEGPFTFMTPKEDGYKLVSYDLGFTKKSRDKDVLAIDILQTPTSGLITTKMIQMTGNNYKYHIPSGIGDAVSKDHLLNSVPNRLPTK
jgi:hypothetical protein